MNERTESGIYFGNAINHASIMSTLEKIDREVAQLPEPLRLQVYQFVRTLRASDGGESFDGLTASSSALAKDWSTPEEDAAWAGL